ncbi:hypothetical protein NBRC111894_4354 [Sporolactobacillus inulinus]|uniref:Uncharacterized protein n=1 Tax=Sporolactobacillus inulinus TaxID=2078 RepID=A0A4Y1ZIG1_9BACL|nr:hypothetical protein NBRC111894_4354 [Sporolactobacillus inulinus]
MEHGDPTSPVQANTAGGHSLGELHNSAHSPAIVIDLIATSLNPVSSLISA